MGPLPWILFHVFVVGMLMLDLLVLHKRGQEISMRSALGWSAFWVGLALAFNVLVYFWRGPELGLQFLAGYLIEESLSVDNLFIFLMLFAYFKVPPSTQHTVLFWGILGALIMRAAFIFSGLALLAKFNWLIYIMGAFLVYGGLKMLFGKESSLDPGKSWWLRLLRRYVPVLKRYHGEKFIVRRGKALYFTPLFLVLLTVEGTDLVFALDSIPAVLAVSQDPFIVYTSNIFAILGLRSIFFALARIMPLFHYLKYGLSVILVFIGAKLILSRWVHIDTVPALLVVAGILILSVLASLVFPEKKTHSEELVGQK